MQIKLFFHKKGFAGGLNLKQKCKLTWKWPITGAALLSALDLKS